tara:strand:- start:14168 stop:14767 length:600 start_codon:yes stop_codon:yes gene_type:complete
MNNFYSSIPYYKYNTYKYSYDYEYPTGLEIEKYELIKKKDYDNLLEIAEDLGKKAEKARNRVKELEAKLKSQEEADNSESDKLMKAEKRIKSLENTLKQLVYRAFKDLIDDEYNLFDENPFKFGHPQELDKQLEKLEDRIQGDLNSTNLKKIIEENLHILPDLAEYKKSYEQYVEKRNEKLKNLKNLKKLKKLKESVNF